MISTNNVRTKPIPTQGLSLLIFMTRGEGLTKLFWTVIISLADRKIQTNKHTHPQQGLPLPPPPPVPIKIHPRRYEKKRESFDLYTAKFESGAMRFWGENSPRRWNPFKTRFPPLSFYHKEQPTANSNSFKIAHKTAFEAKGRLYTTGKVIPRLFIIDLRTQLVAAIYGYRWGKR